MMARSFVLFLSLVFLSSPALAQQVTTLLLRTNHLVYDSFRERLYASVPGNWGPDGNSIAVINPVTHGVERFVWVGSEPNRLALSDDGRYLYVGLDGAFAVRRVDLTTLVPGLQFTLGTTSGGKPHLARDLAVVPGSPGVVAVVRAESQSASSTNVAIFDEGIPRPVATPHAYSGPTELAFTDSSTLFGFNNNYTLACQLARMAVDASGVTIHATRSIAPWGSGWRSRIRFAGGRLYSDLGEVVDPQALLLSGVFRLPDFLQSFRSVAPDAGVGRVYFLAEDTSDTDYTMLRAYKMDTLTLEWSLAFSTASGPADLVQSSATGFAFRASGDQVLLVDVAQTCPLIVGKSGLGDGTITSVGSAAIKCGGSCAALMPLGMTVTLAVTPKTGFRLARWEGDTDCEDGSVTMTTAKSCTAVFEPSAATDVMTLPLVANDLIYSPLSGMLLASIPSTDVLRGNTVTMIDRVTGSVGPSLWVGSEPNRLAVSDDGQILYVGLDGMEAVRQVDLATFTNGARFHLDPGSDVPYYAEAMAVLPGFPASIAVARRVLSSSGDAGVAVYDQGNRRAVASLGVCAGPRSLAFSWLASRLYGYNDSGFCRMEVNDSGASLVDQTNYLITGPGIKYDGGRVYADTGRVIDPEARIVLGTFPVWSAVGVAPDSAHGLVWFLHSPSGQPTIGRYDSARFTPIDSLSISGVQGKPASFTGAGFDRVAFLTRETLYTRGQIMIASMPPLSLAAVRGDIDGDRRADAVVMRPSRGTWQVLPSTGSAMPRLRWGLATDVPVPGDYDGDRKMDLAFFRPSNALWAVRLSSSGYAAETSWQWGAPGDVPVPADYDGDGALEAAVYRPSTGLWALRLTPGDRVVTEQYLWGAPGDVPVPADYDGDGKADLAVYRPSTGAWYMVLSASRYTQSVGWQWGESGDLPVPGDWDGDGRADAAVYRPSTGQWFIRLPGAIPIHWGETGDVPVPADYDGDGRLDVAVYRPATGMWEVLGIMSVHWGAPGDVPVTGR